MIRKAVMLAAAIGLAAPIAMPETAKADPPPWAPAHGYRAKHDHDKHHRHRYRHDDDHDRDYRRSYRYDHGRGNDVFTSQGSFLRCNRDVIGALIGGGAGTALGSTIGKGSGRDAAMIGGAILGLLGGYAVGQNLDQADTACTGYTLQTVPDGQPVRWVNPDSGGTYSMTPQNSWQNRDGRYCREYTATATVGGRRQETYGTACRQPDGSWQIVS